MSNLINRASRLLLLFNQSNYYQQSIIRPLVTNQQLVKEEKTKSIVNESENVKIKKVFDYVNSVAQDPRHSRLFAVVMIAGSQHKVTTDDVILVRNTFYPTIGDKIRLEKVLLVGGKDFTVIGKPILSKDCVKVEATVIEKTLTNDVIRFTYKPRKDNRRMQFIKNTLTLLRINSIDFIGPIPGTKTKTP